MGRGGQPNTSPPERAHSAITHGLTSTPASSDTDRPMALQSILPRPRAAVAAGGWSSGRDALPARCSLAKPHLLVASRRPCSASRLGRRSAGTSPEPQQRSRRREPLLEPRGHPVVLLEPPFAALPEGSRHGRVAPVSMPPGCCTAAACRRSLPCCLPCVGKPRRPCVCATPGRS